MASRMTHTSAVILAAGGSSRMGEPKQLLRVNGEPLIRRAVQTALDSICKSVIVVLGAEASRVRDALAGLAVQTVENKAWADGMGTSIHAGVEAVGDADGLVLMLADQPLVSSETINRLVLTHQAANRPIVASQYAGTVGVPVYFAREYFPHLLALRPEQGCKGLILAHPDQTIRLACPEAEADIDTPQDFERISNQLIERDR